ncbi:MAG: hypothetical protein KF724_09735 [Phycisphaeraceae bacterium]|nr:hypothetical protein [Phycisphaeraceae bacterium]
MGNWTNRLSTGLIAAVVTLLIWTWAAEKTREETTITGTVRFVTAEGQPLSVDPSNALTATLQLRGSRQALQRAGAILEGGADLRLGLGGVPAEAGRFQVELAKVFAELPEIRQLDLSVLNARPDTVTLTIGRLVTQTVPIVAAIPLAQISGSVVIEPPEAQLTLPASLAESIAQPRIEAFVDVRNLEPGRRHTVDAPLRLPESLQSARGLARVEPAVVRVSFILGSRDRTAVIPTVPVQIAGPPADLRNYEIVVEPGSEFLRSVTISGPGDAISQIESGRARIAAIVHLGAEDLVRRSVSKPITLWLLPSGVTVTRIGTSTDTAPAIPLRITERPRTSPPPAVEPTPSPRP